MKTDLCWDDGIGRLSVVLQASDSCVVVQRRASQRNSEKKETESARIYFHDCDTLYIHMPSHTRSHTDSLLSHNMLYCSESTEWGEVRNIFSASSPQETRKSFKVCTRFLKSRKYIIAGLTPDLWLPPLSQTFCSSAPSNYLHSKTCQTSFLLTPEFLRFWRSQKGVTVSMSKPSLAKTMASPLPNLKMALCSMLHRTNCNTGFVYDL